MKRVGRLEDKLWKEVLMPVTEGDISDLLPQQEEAKLGKLARMERELDKGVEVDFGWLDTTVREQVNKEIWALAQGCRDPWRCYRALMQARVQGRYDELTSLMERILAGNL